MAVKTITVTEDAYESVKRLKEGEESFSDLFLRIAKKPTTVKEFIGAFNHTPEEAKEFRERVKTAHKEFGKGLEDRAAYVYS